MSLDARPSRMSLDVRPAPRMSLDSRPRQSLDQRPSPRMPAVEEPYDGFEEVKLDDPRPVKKMSLFSRFGGDHAAKDGAASRPKSGIFNRKDSSEHESELNRVAKEDK